MSRIFLCLLVLSFTGCSHRIGDFTLMGTKNINFEKKHNVDKSTRARVKGEDLVPLVILIPFGFTNIEEAVDDAIEKRQGAVGLVNVTLKNKLVGLCPIFCFIGIEVEGDPVYEK